MQPISPALPGMAHLRSLAGSIGFKIRHEGFSHLAKRPYLTLRAERGAHKSLSGLDLLLGVDREAHAPLPGYAEYVRRQRDALAAATYGMRNARTPSQRAIAEREEWVELLSSWLEEIQ